MIRSWQLWWCGKSFWEKWAHPSICLIWSLAGFIHTQIPLLSLGTWNLTLGFCLHTFLPETIHLQGLDDGIYPNSLFPPHIHPSNRKCNVFIHTHIVTLISEILSLTLGFCTCIWPSTHTRWRITILERDRHASVLIHAQNGWFCNNGHATVPSCMFPIIQSIPSSSIYQHPISQANDTCLSSVCARKHIEQELQRSFVQTLVGNYAERKKMQLFFHCGSFDQLDVHLLNNSSLFLPLCDCNLKQLSRVVHRWKRYWKSLPNGVLQVPNPPNS